MLTLLMLHLRKHLHLGHLQLAHCCVLCLLLPRHLRLQLFELKLLLYLFPRILEMILLEMPSFSLKLFLQLLSHLFSALVAGGRGRGAASLHGARHHLRPPEVRDR